MTLAVNLDWHDLPLGPRLEARLGIPTIVENDVRAAALGLHRRRLFGPVESLALLAIGTGISAGVVLDGALHRGAHGLAGEIGHVIIEPGGPRCACGNQGCFEAVAAGPAIVARTLAGGLGGTHGHDGPARRDPRERRSAPARRRGRLRRGSHGRPGRPRGHRDQPAAPSPGASTCSRSPTTSSGSCSVAACRTPASRSWRPIQRELDRYRAASPLAGGDPAFPTSSSSCPPVPMPAPGEP